VQWKEEKQQQLKKKKEEEAKVEEDFCYCRASALFGYSSSRYFAGGKAKIYACFFFFLGYPWLFLRASSPSFLSLVFVFASFFMRP